MSRPLLQPGAASSLSLAHVWRASDLASGSEKVLASGHAALDRELPGGGWPLGHLVEILHAQPHRHAWQLLGPALCQITRQAHGPVVLVGSPFDPFCPSLAARGLQPARLMKVNADKPAARLWAAEQALRCAEVAAVVAWLPTARAADLRRLHMAAQQQSRLLFVFRSLAARNQSSPARVQLLVEGATELRVTVLKRRGPPMLEPLRLPAHADRLQSLLQSRKRDAAPIVSLPTRRLSHVLDRHLAPA